MNYRLAKKIALWIFLSIVSTVALTMAVAWIYIQINQERIKETVIEIADNTTYGDWRLEGVNISFFEHFPNISLKLKGLELRNSQSGDTALLASVGRGYIAADIIEAIRGSVTVTNISIDRLWVNATDSASTINIVEAISLRDTTSVADTTQTAVYKIDLQNITLSNSYISYFQSDANELVEVNIDRIKSKLYNSSDSLDFYLDLQANIATATMLPMVSGESISFKGDVNFVKANNELFINEGDLSFGPLELSLSGYSRLDSTLHTDMVASMQLKDIGELSIDSKGKIKVKEKGKGYLGLDITTEGAKGSRKIVGEIQASDFIWVTKSGKVEDISADIAFDLRRKATDAFIDIRKLKARYGDNIVDVEMKMVNFQDPEILLKSDIDIDVDKVLAMMDIPSAGNIGGQVKVKSDFYSYWDSNFTLKRDSGYLSMDIDKGYYHPSDSMSMIDSLSGNFIFSRDSLIGKNLDVYMGKNKLFVDMAAVNLFKYLFGERNQTTIGINVTAPLFNPTRLTRRKVFADSTGNIPDRRAISQSTRDSIRMSAIEDIEFNFELTVINNTKGKPPKSYTDINDYIFEFKVRDLTATPVTIAPIRDFSGDMIIRNDSIIIPHAKGVMGRSDVDIKLRMNGVKNLVYDDQEQDILNKLEFRISSNRVLARDIFTYNNIFLLPKDMVNEKIDNLNIDGMVSYSSDSNSTDKATIYISDLRGSTALLPGGLRDGRLHLDATSELIDIKEISGKVGESDFRAEGAIDIIMTEQDTTFTADLKIGAGYINFDQLLGFDAIAEAHPVRGDSTKSRERQQISDDAIAQVRQTMGQRQDRRGDRREDRRENNATLTEVVTDSGETLNVLNIHLPEVTLDVDIASMKYMGVDLDSIRARAFVDSTNTVHLPNLSLQNRGGRVDIKGLAQIDTLTADGVRLVAQIEAKDIDIENINLKIDMSDDGSEYFVLSDNLRGIVDAKMDVSIILTPTLDVSTEGMSAEIDATIKDGELINFSPLEMASRYFKKNDLTRVRFGELSNKITVKDGNIHIPRMNVASTIGNIYIEGNQNFDGTIDYTVEIPWQLIRQAAMSVIFGGKNKGEEEQIIEEATNKKYMTVNIVGNTEDFDVSLGKRKEK